MSGFTDEQLKQIIHLIAECGAGVGVKGKEPVAASADPVGIEIGTQGNVGVAVDEKKLQVVGGGSSDGDGGGQVLSGGSDSSSLDSWADAVESEVAAVRMPPRGPALRRGVNFVASEDEAGFFRQYVKVPRVKHYAYFVRDRCGVTIPKELLVDLALVSYAAGTMPDAFVNGRRKLSGMCAIGDAAIALCVVEKSVAEGVDVASVQALKGNVLSNSMLSQVCVRFGVAAHVAFAPGVNASTAKSGADALEALFGVIYKAGGVAAVSVAMRAMGLL